MIEIIQIVLGALFTLFIPGYLLTRILFDEFSILEKLIFSVAFSIMINVLISIYLGYNEAWAAKTGGLTFTNILFYELIICAILSLALLIKLFWFSKAKPLRITFHSKER